MDRIATGWNAAGVRWALLREPGVEVPVKGDIDILVHPEDLDRAVAVGRGLGAARLVSRGRGTHTFLVTYSPGDRAWLELDIVTEIAFGEWAQFPLLAAGPILGSRVPVGDSALFALPDAERFWLNVLHCVLDKRHVTEHRAAAMARCAANVDGVDGSIALSALTVIVGPDEARGLARSARAADWDSLVNREDTLRAAFQRTHGLVVTRRRLAGRIARGLEKPSQWRSRRGLGMALLGPDGSGKSTLSAQVAAVYHFPTQAAYFGLWKEVHTASPIPKASAVLLRPFLAMRLYATALAVRWSGRTVVFDRYALDARLPAQPPGAWLKNIYLWVVGRSCPGPDAVVLLDVPAEVMFARKGEMGLERLETMRQDYATLASTLKVPTLTVDGTHGVEDITARVVEFMWAQQRTRLDRAAR